MNPIEVEFGLMLLIFNRFQDLLSAVLQKTCVGLCK